MKSHFLKQSISINILIIISVLTIFVTFPSCDREDEINNKHEIIVDNNNDKEETVVNDNYYVKYVIKGEGSYKYFRDWSVTTPEGIYTKNNYQIKHWEQTYGPVKKGFKCEVKIGGSTGGEPTIEIYVSINQEPFALKVTKTGYSASYTIE